MAGEGGPAGGGVTEAESGVTGEVCAEALVEVGLAPAAEQVLLVERGRGGGDLGEAVGGVRRFGPAIGCGERLGESQVGPIGLGDLAQTRGGEEIAGSAGPSISCMPSGGSWSGSGGGS